MILMHRFIYIYIHRTAFFNNIKVYDYKWFITVSILSSKNHFWHFSDTEDGFISSYEKGYISPSGHNVEAWKYYKWFVSILCLHCRQEESIVITLSFTLLETNHMLLGKSTIAYCRRLQNVCMCQDFDQNRFEKILILEW